MACPWQWRGRLAGGGVQARAQPGAAAGAQHRHHGHGRHARGACRADSYSHSLLGASAGGEPAPPRPQERADRSQPAVPDRHAGHRHAAAAQPAPGLWAGPRQLGHHRGARQPTRPWSSRRRTTSTPPQRGHAAAGCAAGCAAPQLPRFLPDTRSMLIGAAAFRSRRCPSSRCPRAAADPRVGLFTTTVLDFSDDLRTRRRASASSTAGGWRRRTRRPSCPIPVKPITFWIDRNVPLAYRETVRAAILEWNKAFEKIGLAAPSR
jgi:hypothetical protein